jgi:hypothetical protein
MESFIIKYVCKSLGIRPHELPREYAEYAIKMLNLMDSKLFEGYDIREVGPALGNVLADMIREKYGNINLSFDMKDLQNKMLNTESDILSIGPSDVSNDISGSSSNTEINIVDFLGVKTADEFKLYINPESSYQHFYLVLDSEYRNTTAEIDTSITRFTWNYAPTQNVGTGYCNSVGVIRDIIGMRMYQPRVPYLAAMNTNSKRVSVLIEEFSAQAFIDSSGRRYHFLLRPNFITGQTDIELSTEDYNDGIFNFRKPITTFSTISISFGNPSNILTFATPFNRFIIPFEFICLKSNK